MRKNTRRGRGRKKGRDDDNERKRGRKSGKVEELMGVGKRKR